MEKWQIEKVNELYKQLDQLQQENLRLKHTVEISRANKRLEVIENKLDQLTKLVEGGTTSTTKRKK